MARNDCAMTASSGHAQLHSARPLDGAVAESITKSGRKIRRQDRRGEMLNRLLQQLVPVVPGIVRNYLAGAGELGENGAVVAVLVDGEHSVGFRPAAYDV